MEKKTLLLVVGLLLAVGGLGAAQTVSWEGSESVEFDAVNGPTVTLGEQTALSSTDPTPDDTTVDLGPIELTGDGSATISSVAGSETTLSNIQTSGTTLWANHSQAQRVGVENIDSITWDDVDLTDDTVDIQTSGTGTIYVDGFSPNQDVRVDTQDGASLQSADGAGVLSINVDDDDLTLTEPATPELLSPAPDGDRIDASPVTLQVDVRHEDFAAGETVTVDWTLNGEEIATTSTSQEGLASVDVTNFTGGQNTWSATATDSTGDTATVSGTFSTPATLYIRDELNPDQLVDNQTELEVTFFGESGDTVETRPAPNGTVDMSGLPLDESFSVQASAEGYQTRQSFARSVVERQTIYLLNSSVDTVETQFRVDDPTGKFNPESSRVFVKKPITQNGTTEYRVVVADEVGSGGWTTTLAQGERYLIEVEDVETGDTRDLGPYVAGVSEQVVLEVDELSFDFSENIGDVGFDFNTRYENASNAEPFINFQFAAESTIDRLEVTVHKQHNESIVILDETYRNHDGPIDVRATLPESIEDPDTTNWVVNWTATIDGDTVSSETLVGKGNLEVGFFGIGGTILSIGGVLIVLVVAGLFGQADASVGAIATSLVAGALWFIGVLPEAVSGIFIAIALMLGIIYHIRRGPQQR